MTSFPKTIKVEPLDNKQLRVKFDNGTVKIYDCKPLLYDDVFAPLKEQAFFKNVRVDPAGYGIFWNDEIDLSEAELWINGVETSSESVTV